MSTQAQKRSLRLGWVSLCAWSLVGLSMEAAHAFKWAAFFDDELARLLVRLAHAHGVGLALVVLAHSATAAELIPGRFLRAGAVLVPVGFFLGAIAHPEGDPSFGIFLAPMGALLFLFDLVRIAWKACRNNTVDG
ncbi:MAG: hypothetical protein ACI9KE_001440 [Polyangiales bacterium]|jgi:hypothetical protein